MLARATARKTTTEVIQYLLEKGANPYLSSKYGTAVEIAASRGRMDLVRLMLPRTHKIPVESNAKVFTKVFRHLFHRFTDRWLVVRVLDMLRHANVKFEVTDRPMFMKRYTRYINMMVLTSAGTAGNVASPAHALMNVPTVRSLIWAFVV